MMTLLYFITTDDGFLTVGLTQNVERRLSDLQTGNHRPLSCRAVMEFSSKQEALAVESMLIDELAGSHEHGRWYRVTPLSRRLMWAATLYQRPDGIISRGRRSEAKQDPDRHPRSSVRWSEVPWPDWMDEVDRANMMRLHRSPGAVRDAVKRLGRRYQKRQ